MSADPELGRLQKRLLREIGTLNEEFGLIEANDRIMVGLSGGKDSYALMDLLDTLRRRAPVPFSLIGVNLDQGHPGFPQHVISDWCEARGYEHKMLNVNTYAVVLEKIPAGKTYCSLCSRLRRGVLYNAAVELGCTKIALGHHRDDLLETALLNLFFSGQLKTMPPKLQSDDGRNVVIRPLASCSEDDVAAYAKLSGFPIVPCNLCGSQENLQRAQMKALLKSLEAQNPAVKQNMLHALRNVKPTHLLDRDLLSRLGLTLPQANDDSLMLL